MPLISVKVIEHVFTSEDRITETPDGPTHGAAVPGTYVSLVRCSNSRMTASIPAIS